MRTAIASIVLSVLLSSGPARGAWPSGKEVVRFKAQPFPLNQVRLLEGPLEDAMERNRRYLLDLDADRLLHMFRVTAGLPSSAEPLGGWEEPECEVRGHTTGHYLSACALLYASTGDERIKSRADDIVSELAKCQKALGTGYLSAFEEGLFNRLEAGKRVWVPWYTLHKLLAGLHDMYVHCENPQALDAAKGMIAWAKERTDRLSDEHMARVLNVEFGGMNEVLYNLYGVTGDRDCLKLAGRFDHKRIVDPLAARRDELKGLHVNTTIPKITGAARGYELTADKRHHDIAEFFWNQVTTARAYCTGGTSNHEHWRSDPYHLANELSGQTQESCCTYNMLKLTRHVFAWTADPRCADYYERAFFNGILGTQNPEDGMLMYFVPLDTGYWKLFCLPTESFWCCTGTGIESFAKLGDSIYFHAENALYVNLFIASELKWPQKGIRIRQETNFPEQEGTTLVVHADKPVALSLNLRVPYWTTRGGTVRLNGRPAEAFADPSSFLTLRRTWKDGDRVEISMPMSLHAHPMPDDETLQAIMYGPLVLVGELGAEGLTRKMMHGHAPHGQTPQGTALPRQCIVTESDDLTTWIKPVAGKPLTFRTSGQAKDVTLVPFYRLFGQRYAAYWHVYRRGSDAHRKRLAEDAARAALLARTVDRVTIGNAKSEADHKLQGERTQAGPHLDRHWRHANRGGWFSYTLKVLPEQPVILTCSYWGSESGARTFDILVDGKRLATRTLNNDKPDSFFDVDYKIPVEWTRGKQMVTVRFQAHADNMAGGVFGCAIMKPK